MTPKQEKSFTMRLTISDYQRFKKIADSVGLSLAAWIRFVLHSAATEQGKSK
jgi:predicted DNA binding CopG/RHH family protein